MLHKSFFVSFGVLLFAFALLQFGYGRAANGLQAFLAFLAVAAFIGIALPPVTQQSLATVLGFLLVLLSAYGLLHHWSFLGIRISAPIAASSFVMGLWAFANAFLRWRSKLPTLDS